MSRKIVIILAVILIFSFALMGCGGNKSDSKEQTNTVTNGSAYIEGDYEGQSAPTDEGYYGKAKVTIKDGKINDVDFYIVDGTCQDRLKLTTNKDVLEKGKGKNERIFDETYGPDVFSEYPEYLDQCIGDLSGIEKYKDLLVSVQDVQKVDVITGATWSNKIFKDTIENALKKAEKK